jgi:hypothetical protein
MHLCKLILRILHELERMILQQQRSFSLLITMKIVKFSGYG